MIRVTSKLHKLYNIQPKWIKPNASSGYWCYKSNAERITSLSFLEKKLCVSNRLSLFKNIEFYYVPLLERDEKINLNKFIFRLKNMVTK